MRTAEQWLKQKNLSIELAKVFTPEGEWKHDFHQYEIEDQHVVGPCKKCKASYPQKLNSTCPIPDPIKLDWNTAKKWEAHMFDTQPFEYRRTLQSLYQDHPTMWQIILDRDPKKRLIAAAMAMEGAKHE